ncbi:MAG: hypothetical protein ACYC2P_12855 [Paludibacteraceae bacterium]
MKLDTEGSRIHEVLQSDGIPITHFVYDYDGNLIERESFLSYTKYTYQDDKLIKEETATDPQVFSSTVYTEKSEFMTAINSTFNSYSDYGYASTGELTEKKNYLLIEGSFQYRSKCTYEYEDGKIIRKYLYNSDGKITQHVDYRYDQRGNVILEKDYSYLNADNKPKLITESTYKFDSKSNPFFIFRQVGEPGYFTNANNIIETKRISNNETLGINNNTDFTPKYEYNPLGCPVKEINGNTTYLYVYE